MAVATSSIAKASRVDRACERLEAAISRLESAMDANAGASLATMAANSDGLDVVRRENSDLRALNRNTAEKLDGAISKIERLIAASGT